MSFETLTRLLDNVSENISTIIRKKKSWSDFSRISYSERMRIFWYNNLSNVCLFLISWKINQFFWSTLNKVKWDVGQMKERMIIHLKNRCFMASIKHFFFIQSSIKQVEDFITFWRNNLLYVISSGNGLNALY